MLSKWISNRYQEIVKKKKKDRMLPTHPDVNTEKLTGTASEVELTIRLGVGIAPGLAPAAAPTILLLCEPSPAPLCEPKNDWPAGVIVDVLCEEWAELPKLELLGPFSPEGSGLFLMSFTAVVEELGVPWLEEPGEWVFAVEFTSVLWDDAVPETLSFLLFEVLFGSLARESCSCWVR